MKSKNHIVGLAGLCLSAFLTAGCDTGKSKEKWNDWRYRRDANHQVKVALEAENADKRRVAITRLMDTRAVTADWAFQALDAIARTDENEAVRIAAVRAFRKYNDERPVPVLLALMNDDANAQAVRPVSKRLRWECVGTLDDLNQRSCVPDERMDAMIDVCVVTLRDVDDRNAKMASALALGSFCDRRALDALIAGMQTRDFGVAHACEESLRYLTGQNFNHRADRWSEWAAQQSDPFAAAGQTPADLERSKASWWEKTQRSFAAWQGEPAQTK